MASSRPPSPTPSCSSSGSSVFPSSSKFSGLPVMALKDRIVEKILENRVTLIVGETGCGKSSQVPQFLVEKNIAPILCTQPRRFAVLAVAKMVAKARNCEMGEEVGYHIGHSKVLSPRSKIVFKTAGVLLDEMRDKGPNALKYKVIILDEVHERSVESDLVLVCLKQFLLKKKDLRIVLMSATADIGKYKDYFRDLGRGERVEVLAIPNCGQQTVFQRRVSYLEEVAELLGQSKESLSSRHFGTGPSTTDADIKPEMHQLIHDLVLHIHENEPDVEKSILIFLPTYYALEQQWHHLKPFSFLFKVHILHRSIDTEQALMAMKIWKSHRKVILATNIAESSVTIPKVAFVIDSCRSLQIFWDTARKKDAPELVWVSKSQAEQRRGRTGRTCDGHVYRMVPSSFFSQLEEYECPAILKLSLRLQVLQICCAESRSINDPKALLQKALSGPDSEVVEDALSLLVHMKALEKPSSRGRYEPTLYGRLLGSFTLSFDASMMVLKFGESGLLREGIVLGVLMDTLPLPIYQPFADELLQTMYRHSFFRGDKNTVLTGRKEVDLLANLCAFQFWQRVFKDKHRLDHLKELLLFDDSKTKTTQLVNTEGEWCSFHNLLQSSLLHVSEMYEEILHSLHRFRPKFLSMASGLPTYYHPYEFDHICLLQCQPQEVSNGIPLYDEQPEQDSQKIRCSAEPFVGSEQFDINIVAAQLADTIKEIRVQLAAEMSSGHSLIGGNDSSSHFSADNTVCVFFLKGFCSRGSLCRFSHSFGVNRPPCKFFFSLQGCRYGQACSFSHEQPYSLSSCPTGCFPEDSAPGNKFLQLLPTSSDGCVLLLDDADLHFSSSLSHHYDPKKIISTTSLQDTNINIPSLTGARIMWGLYHPHETIISKAGENPIPWDEIKLILWSPDLDGYSENLDQQIILVRNFFEYMAIRILGDALYDTRVVFTVNNIKFSQLQAEKLGRDSFFFLTESFPYDEASFGELSGNVTIDKPMVSSRAISYVFDLHPPSDIQFGNYAAVIQKRLYSMW